MTLLSSSSRILSRETFPSRDQKAFESFPPTDTPPDLPVLPVTSSPRGMIQVLGYTPREGERGVPITVHINYKRDSLSSVYIRLLVGQRPVATHVRQLDDAGNGRWQLDAIAPPLDRYSRSSRALLSVQALGKNDTVLDSVTFGEFVYWISDRPDAGATYNLRSIPGDGRRKRHLSAPSPDMAVQSALLRYGRTRTPAPPPPNSNAVAPNAIMGRTPQITRRSRSASNLTTEDHNGQTPVLQLLTPLEQICQNWHASEVARGRRLVRFQKLQEGRRLIVSCEPIRQEDYCETDTVISCIYREKTDECFVTSVDIIYLLERLTNDEFPVEEKNRIRRNLEGLRPTTVSKHKPGFEQFFQTIMDFPDPKPRNIEKDLKVFEWSLLGQALEKILSKYIIYDPSAPKGDSRSCSPKSEPKEEVPQYQTEREPEFTMDSEAEKKQVAEPQPQYSLDEYLAPTSQRHPYLEPLRLPLKQELSLDPLLIASFSDGLDTNFHIPESTSPVSTMMPETPTQPTFNPVRMSSDSDLALAAYWMEPQLISDTQMFDFMDVVNQPKEEYTIDSLLNIPSDYKPY